MRFAHLASYLFMGSLAALSCAHKGEKAAIQEPGRAVASEQIVLDANGRPLGQDNPAPNEDERFKILSDRTEAAMKKLAAKGDKTFQRGFHTKQHGCLNGTMTVKDPGYHMARQGIFTVPGRVYPVRARFSNGISSEQRDSKFDLRGLAVKVFKVDGDQVLPERGAARTQDFVMFNTELALFPVAEDAVVMLEESAEGRFDLVKFALRRPPFAALMATKIAPPDLLTQTYFNASAIKFGPYAGKVRMRNCQDKVKTPKTPLRTDPDYLRKRLVKSLAKEEVCFKVEAQFQLDAVRETVEDGHVAWKTPNFELAEIRFPAQEFDTPEKQKACKDLAFTPWNAIADHRPLGETMRMRKAIYQRSQWLRGPLPPEPVE